MDQPAQYRLVYHAGTRQFFIAYHFGLAKDTARFPSSAGFRFVLLSGIAATHAGRGWQVSLRPQQAEVLCLSRKSK
jgi:hypothetical protein